MFLKIHIYVILVLKYSSCIVWIKFTSRGWLGRQILGRKKLQIKIWKWTNHWHTNTFLIIHTRTTFKVKLLVIWWVYRHHIRISYFYTIKNPYPLLHVLFHSWLIVFLFFMSLWLYETPKRNCKVVVISF